MDIKIENYIIEVTSQDYNLYKTRINNKGEEVRDVIMYNSPLPYCYNRIVLTELSKIDKTINTLKEYNEIYKKYYNAAKDGIVIQELSDKSESRLLSSDEEKE